MNVMSRSEYVAASQAADDHPHGATKVTMQRMLECIASYRIACHHLAPLLHAAIAEAEREKEWQRLDELRDILKDIKRGES